MTYFGFLLRFIVIPLVVFLIIALIDEKRGKTVSGFRNGRAVWLSIGLHVIIAVLYTTPWDNYLVATGVWYYNPELITGILLGWVPIEEYTFFIVETIFVGLWWWFLARRITPPDKFSPSKNIRIISTAILGVVWLASIIMLASGWRPGVYLSLILGWALPPIMLQMAYGADILWHHRKLVAGTILPAFLYLSATDSIALTAGTWTIDPAQSTGILIGSLPVEEGVFFLVTVVLISFGVTLSLALVSQTRLLRIKELVGQSNKLSGRANG